MLQSRIIVVLAALAASSGAARAQSSADYQGHARAWLRVEAESARGAARERRPRRARILHHHHRSHRAAEESRHARRRRVAIERRAPAPAPAPAVADYPPVGFIPAIITAIVEAAARPFRLVGLISLDGRDFRYVSGGRGRGSIPYGSYEITPGAVGSWGRRHGAVGLSGGEIEDPKYPRRPREGIELHAAYGSQTAGCVGVREWRAFKSALLGAIRRYGRAFLNVGPGGAASVTPAALFGARGG